MITYNELWTIQEPLLAMAAVFDGIFRFSGAARSWKMATAEWWYKLQLIKWPDKHKISGVFYDLFITIFGTKTLSVRRILLSAIASCIFLVAIYYSLEAIMKAVNHDWPSGYYGIPDIFSSWYIGYYEFVPTYSIKHLFGIIYGSFGLNVIPDFISLCQTGYIIKLASRKGSSLLKLSFLDFILTTLIAVSAHIIMIIIFVNTYDSSISELLNMNYTLQSCPDKFSYILTTYFTSISWLGFIITVSSIAALKRSSDLMVWLFETKIVQDIPFLLIVGVPCLISWPILFIINITN